MQVNGVENHNYIETTLRGHKIKSSNDKILELSAIIPLVIINKMKKRSN